MRALVVLASVLVVGGCQKSEAAICLDESAAYDFAKRTISQQLRAPTTAMYPSRSDDGVTVVRRITQGSLPPCSFIVYGFVDSQNAFGAMIRTEFYLAVGYAGDGRWEVVEEPRLY